jgi:hypothetical protein
MVVDSSANRLNARRNSSSPDVLHPEAPARLVQLPRPHLPQGPPGGDGRVTDLPGLAPGGRDDHRLPALGHVPGQGAAGAEDLVIGVGEHAQQPHDPES